MVAAKGKANRDSHTAGRPGQQIGPNQLPRAVQRLGILRDPSLLQPLCYVRGHAVYGAQLVPLFLK